MIDRVVVAVAMIGAACVGCSSGGRGRERMIARVVVAVAMVEVVAVVVVVVALDSSVCCSGVGRG